MPSTPHKAAAPAGENLGAPIMFGPDQNRDEMSPQDWQQEVLGAATTEA